MLNTNRWHAVLAATLGGAVALTGSAFAQAPVPQPGGSITIGISADPNCLDPQQNGAANSINIGRNVVDSLVDLDPATGAVVPWLASAWSVNEDATEFTFTLRDGVTFSDGTALTAEIVKANFDTVVTLGSATSLVTGYLAGYAGTEVVDEHTVRVSFSAPNAGFLPTTSVIQLGIVGESTLALTAEQRCLATNVVGTGPFVFDSYRQNEATVLARRAGYAWPSQRSAHDGEAYLETVTYQVVAESSARTGSLLAGQLHAITDVQSVDEDLLTGSNFQVIARSNPGVVNTIFVRNGTLAAEEAVRKAIQVALDRGELASVLSASYAPATSVLAASTPGYADFSDLLAPNLEQAALLLDEAGWAIGSDGVRARDGVALSVDIAYISSVVTAQSVLELAQQQLARIGVDLRLRPLALADYLAAVREPALNLSFGNYTRADLDVLRSGLSLGASASRLSDDALEQLYVDLQSAADADQRNAIGAELQQKVIENAYVIPVYELAQVAGVSPTLQGVEWDSSSRLVLYNAWLSAQ